MDFTWWCKDTVSSAVAPWCGIWEGRNSIYMGLLCLYTFLSRMEENLLMKVFPQSSLVSPQGRQSGPSSWLTLPDCWVTLSGHFCIFSWQGRSPTSCRAVSPTSAPTLNTGLDIYPTELALFESDQQLQPLTPWPRLLAAVPHPAAPSVYKRKLASQSTEKQEMTVQREVLAGSSVLPRDSEAQRQSEQECVHWPAPCFSNSAAELAAVWGEFSAISSRGSAGRWGKKEISVPDTVVHTTRTILWQTLQKVNTINFQ